MNININLYEVTILIKLIKTSFILTLFIGIFSMGLSNAYAKKAKTNKTVIKSNKATKTKVVPLRCQMESMANLSIVLYNGSKKSFNYITTFLDPTCEPGSFQIGHTIVIVDSDCNVRFITVESK